MTPKEYANELIGKFHFENNYGISENTGIECLDYKQGIQCAIICVEQILEQTFNQMDEEWDKYYQQVKQELINYQP